MASQSTIPTAEDMAQAAEMFVYNASGEKVLFGDLIKDQKTIVLATVRKEALSEASVTLLVIGCGDYQPIKSYAENTGFTGPIYANPSLDLFRHFNFAENLERTPSGQPKRSYLGNTSLVGNVLSSIWVSEFSALFGRES
ncbi:hypothetical protein EIP86_004687 [Pleurotus ostreatoroseus]|nr:hypothetical protein EIP86_004687 [Pleurotus ostreatoroseus]